MIAIYQIPKQMTKPGNYLEQFGPEVFYKLIALTMAAGMNPFAADGCNPLDVATRYFSDKTVINKLPAGVGSCKEMVCASTGLLL